MTVIHSNLFDIETKYERFGFSVAPQTYKNPDAHYMGMHRSRYADKWKTVHNSSCLSEQFLFVALMCICGCVCVCVCGFGRFKKVLKIVIVFRSFDVIFHGVSLMFWCYSPASPISNQVDSFAVWFEAISGNGARIHFSKSGSERQIVGATR